MEYWATLNLVKTIYFELFVSKTRKLSKNKMKKFKHAGHVAHIGHVKPFGT